MLNRDKYFNADMKKEMFFLFIAIAFIGLSQGFSENIWTNFYNVIGMKTTDRTLLEPIRELPGLLMMFIIAAISFLTLGRMGAMAMVTRAAGLILIGLFTNTFTASFITYMVIVSLGDHVFMPLRNSIGISVAKAGYEGRVIGLMDATTTIMYTLASLPILLLFNGKTIGDYRILFFLAAGAAFIAGAALFVMHTRKAGENLSKPRFVWKRKYALYYIISFISGLRKQIFLVFAPWLLVKTFGLSLQTMTLLNIVGAVTIFFFNPFMGHLIDKYGERRLLVGGGVACAILYTGYTFLCTQPTGNPLILFVLLSISFLDRLSQSTLMGRDVFVKHTAEDPGEIMPTLSVGVSMDHIASVVAPIFGGLLWTSLGPQWVFGAGVVIAILYTWACSWVPGKKAASSSQSA